MMGDFVFEQLVLDDTFKIDRRGFACWPLTIEVVTEPPLLAAT